MWDRRSPRLATTIVLAGLVVGTWLLFARGALAVIDGALHVPACGTYHTPAGLARLAAEQTLLRTIWRGRAVAVPLAAAPPGTARLETAGGPRRHFWLVHDAWGLVAFRATSAVLRLREEDVEFRARWTGAGWAARAASEDSAPVFFFHRVAHTYDREGRSILGPAARDLDRFPVRVTGDEVVVDTAIIVPGAARVTAGADCYP